MYRRKRMYRRRKYGRKPATVRIATPYRKLKRLRIQRALGKDTFFTRLFASDHITFTIQDGGTYAFVNGPKLQNSAAWTEMAAHYQFVKVHKVIVKVLPGINISDPTTQVGLHAIAVFKMENGSQTPLKPDANIKYNDVMGLPNAKSARQTKGLTIAYKPAMSVAGPEADSVTGANNYVRYSTNNWINLNFAIPELQGFAYCVSQGGKTAQSVTMFFEYYIYCTFKGTKRTLHL